MSTTFPVRGLDTDSLERIDTAARAKGMSRNAYVVDLLQRHAREVRPPFDARAFADASQLAADLGDEEFRRAGWR